MARPALRPPGFSFTGRIYVWPIESIKEDLELTIAVAAKSCSAMSASQKRPRIDGRRGLMAPSSSWKGTALWSGKRKDGTG